MAAHWKSDRRRVCLCAVGLRKYAFLQLDTISYLRCRGQKTDNFTMASAAPVQPDGARRGIKALVARYPLLFYFIVAYAFAWLAEMPLVLSEDGAGLLSYRWPLGLYAHIAIASFVGPFLSAFIMTGITEGREGVGRLVHRMVLWRVGFRWYCSPSSASPRS